MFTEHARAKINLTLHIGRAIMDPRDMFYAYHPLDSLVVFADLADKLQVQPGDKTDLKVQGPFVDTLCADVGYAENLVLKAYRMVARECALPPLIFTLEKNLPVAAGIGGGSANAAAALRLLRHWAALPEAVWQRFCLALGADVPVCFASRSARMTGIGADVQPLADLNRVAAVLIYPNVALSTADIFSTFDESSVAEPMPRLQKSKGSLLERAVGGCNSLQAVASRKCPQIPLILQALTAQKGCALARMSGSGSTCFGLFHGLDMAEQAAQVLSGAHPDWWVQSTLLGDI